MNTTQNEIKEILFHLTEIKRCYPITQMFDLKSRTITSFQRQVSPNQMVTTLSKMLGLVMQNMQNFTSTLSKNSSDDVPRERRCHDYFFAITRRESMPEDTCCKRLQANASKLYYCLMLTYEKIVKIKNNDWADYIPRLKVMAQEFNLFLGNLSDSVEKFSIHSSAFSLARHMELLDIHYQGHYEKAYKYIGFFSWFTLVYNIKVLHRSSCRESEISFLKQVSTHLQCNDEIRYSSIKVLAMKIVNGESSNNSLLNTLLESGISHTVVRKREEICIKKVLDFCHNNKIILPDGLQQYVNQIMRNQENELKKSNRQSIHPKL